jgi:hypothetical protein
MHSSPETISDAAAILFSSLRTRVFCFFDEDNGNQPFPGALGDLAFGTPENVLDERHLGSRPKDVLNWLSDAGLVQFAHYREGGTAIVYVGQTAESDVFAVRTPKAGSLEAAHMRDDLPMVVQPFGQFPTDKNKTIEILPLVPVIGDENDMALSVQPVAMMLLRRMFNHAGLDVMQGLSDMCAFPGGQIGFVDPDRCRKSNRAVTIETITTKAKAFASEYHPLDCVADWLDEHGKSRQSQFFQRRPPGKTL